MGKLSMELMHTVESLEELKKKVQQMCREGKVGARQAGQLIRRWRVHNRQINFRKKVTFQVPFIFYEFRF